MLGLRYALHRGIGKAGSNKVGKSREWVRGWDYWVGGEKKVDCLPCFHRYPGSAIKMTWNHGAVPWEWNDVLRDSILWEFG